MLIWIGKHRREDCGATQAQVCERCHNYVRYNLVRQHRMVSFNFIPLFAIGNTWRHECPICARGQELVGEEIETQKRAALLAAAHAYAIKQEGDTLALVRPRSIATVPPSFAPVTPECQSQAETTENDTSGQKLRLKVVAGVVAALVAVAAVCVAIIAPKNAPASSSSSPSMQAIAPSTTAQTALPRTPSRANARRSGRTQSRTAASSAALPHAGEER
jgi:hypothetical protein